MPPKIQEAMQMQVEAERKKRAAILESEGKRAGAVIDGLDDPSLSVFPSLSSHTSFQASAKRRSMSPKAPKRRRC